uniref:Putative methyltransferase n=1 Tax=viral metagenome TaxID=1070528 RepID=A0A6M3J9M9_9ZZZZ
MTATTDILAKWAFEIDCADVEVERGTADNVPQAIHDLAAELRALREKLALQKPDATLGQVVREGGAAEVSKARPKLLDLFSGAGGAGMGYHRAGFDVVGVDNRPQRHYPFEFHQADALEYLAEHGREFDVVHASPPCQRYCRLTPPSRRDMHPDLLPAVAEILRGLGKPYIIENIPDAKTLLREPFMLCGTMFGLPIWRHRFFEGNCLGMVMLPPCNHSGIPILVSGTTRRKGYARRDTTVALRRAAMGIEWMTTEELDQAIPLAYTEWIGRQILQMGNLT